MVFAVLAMTTNHAAAWRRDVVIRLLDGRTMNANDPAAVKACLDQGGKVETGHNGAKICMPGLTKNGNITLKKGSTVPATDHGQGAGSGGETKTKHLSGVFQQQGRVEIHQGGPPEHQGEPPKH